MKFFAAPLIISFLFATLFLSFALASCGTSDTPICSSIFGMNTKDCDANPLEHHTAIAEQPTLCTFDALANALTLTLGIIVSIVAALSLMPLALYTGATLALRLTHIFPIMNPFDPLRFAFIRGTIQQKRDVRLA